MHVVCTSQPCGFFSGQCSILYSMGMGLRRDDEDFVRGYVSGLLYLLWHTVNGAEEAWGRGQQSGE